MPLAEVGPTTRTRRILPWTPSKTGALRRVGRGALVVLLPGRPRRDAGGHPPHACPSRSSRRAPDGRTPAHEHRANARARGGVRRALEGRTATDTHSGDDRQRPGGDVRAVGRPRGGRAPIILSCRALHQKNPPLDHLKHRCSIQTNSSRRSRGRGYGKACCPFLFRSKLIRIFLSLLFVFVTSNSESRITECLDGPQIPIACCIFIEG